MKKRWFFIVPLIVILLGTVSLVMTSVSAKSEASLARYIANRSDIAPTNILKTASRGDYFAVLYSNGAAEEMMILEKNLIGRYTYSGGGSSSQDISSYNYNEANSWSLIIVYGDNRNIRAQSYEFTNDNKKFTRENLENYILDIYIIEDTNLASSDGVLLDKNGNELGMF